MQQFLAMMCNSFSIKCDCIGKRIVHQIDTTHTLSPMHSKVAALMQNDDDDAQGKKHIFSWSFSYFPSISSQHASASNQQTNVKQKVNFFFGNFWLRLHVIEDDFICLIFVPIFDQKFHRKCVEITKPNVTIEKSRRGWRRIWRRRRRKKTHPRDLIRLQWTLKFITIKLNLFLGIDF